MLTETHAVAAAHEYGLAHQFEDMDQQNQASTLGMWLFLVTEIMFFGGIFLGYLVYRMKYLPGFAEASHHLDIKLGAFNTAVLIGSSLTMALAVHASQMAWRKLLVLFLLLTMALGLTFLGVKVVEYSHKFEENLAPGPDFTWHGQHPRAAQIFYSFYFGMTGMHALHMIIGIAIMIPLVAMSARGRFTATWYSPIELFGLYWHFVDIVWIFLFPLLYLIGAHHR